VLAIAAQSAIVTTSLTTQEQHKMRIRMQKIRANIEKLTAQAERLGIKPDEASVIFDAAPDEDEKAWLKYYRAHQPEMEAGMLYLHIKRLQEMLSS